MLNMFYSHKNSFDVIKIGDKIIYQKLGGMLKIDTVISETSKRFKTDGGIEIFKSNNTIYGDGSLVRLFTEEIEKNLEFYTLAFKLKYFDFEKLPFESLKEIKLIIDSKS